MQPNAQAPNPPQSYTEQKAHRNHGMVWLVLFILTFLLLLGCLGFAIWAYMGREDYKYNADQKIAAAVEVAKQQTASEKDNEFLEKEKLPLKDYQGPSAYGAVLIKYPKTWGAYVDERESGQNAINGYFHPIFVPGTQTKTAYALRLAVVNTSYDEELKKFDAKVKQGKVSVSPYRVPKIKNVQGVRISGEIATNIQGTMVLLPLRDKTLKVWTEANQFLKDFDNHVMSNLTFSP